MKNHHKIPSTDSSRAAGKGVGNFSDRAWNLFTPKDVVRIVWVEKIGGTYNVGPPNDSVQLVQISPITMVYGTYNYSYWGL